MRRALKKVVDPELGVSIVDLGLIYDVREEKGTVEVEMTLTSPGCPLAGVIDDKIKGAVKGIKGVKKVTVEITSRPQTKLMIHFVKPILEPSPPKEFLTIAINYKNQTGTAHPLPSPLPTDF